MQILKSDIDKLVSYYDYFNAPSSNFYTSSIGYMLESKEITAFRKDLYDTGFIIVFDWKDWLKHNEIYTQLELNIDSYISNADIDTLRKLMTCYIRGDRFNEGLFIQVCANGIVTSILKRLREIGEKL